MGLFLPLSISLSTEFLLIGGQQDGTLLTRVVVGIGI